MFAGVKCPYFKKNVTNLQCTLCEGHCGMFPEVLRKKYLFGGMTHFRNQISITAITGCLRESFYKATKPQYYDIDSIIALNLGIGIHEHLQNVFPISEKKLVWKTPNGNEVIGYLDGIQITQRTLIDIKTTKFAKYKLECPLQVNYRRQVNCYYTMLKKLYGIELDKLKILFIGMGDRMAFEMDVPKEDMEMFINEKSDWLYKCIKENKPPKGESPEWGCRYCSFKEECLDVERGE